MITLPIPIGDSGLNFRVDLATGDLGLGASLLSTGFGNYHWGSASNTDVGVWFNEDRGAFLEHDQMSWSPWGTEFSGFGIDQGGNRHAERLLAGVNGVAADYFRANDWGDYAHGSTRQGLFGFSDHHARGNSLLGNSYERYQAGSPFTGSVFYERSIPPHGQQFYAGSLGPHIGHWFS